MQFLQPSVFATSALNRFGHRACNRYGIHAAGQHDTYGHVGTHVHANRLVKGVQEQFRAIFAAIILHGLSRPIRLLRHASIKVDDR